MRELLAPFITLLFNRSLVTGCFQSELKQAIVRPRLKNSGLDASDGVLNNGSVLRTLIQACIQLVIPLQVVREGVTQATTGLFR